MIRRLNACVAALVVSTSIGTAAFSQDEDVWALIEQPTAEPQASLTGDFQERSTMDLVADDAYEDFATTRALLYARFNYRASDEVSVVLSGLGDYIFRINSEGRENGALYEARVEEFYAALHRGRLDVRLGQQLVTWGKTDVISPTDRVNAQDYRHIIDTELGHVKIPALMAKADYYPEPFHLEAVFLPFAQPARLDLIDGDWAVFGNRVPVTDATGSFDDTERGRRAVRLLDRWFPDWEDNLEEALSDDRLNAFGPPPVEQDLEHWETGARAGAKFAGVDASLSYLYAFGDIPTVYLNPTVRKLAIAAIETDDAAALPPVSDPDELFPVVDVRYERTHQFGADFEANLGPSVLRAEGSYTYPQRLYTDELEVVERPMATYTAGADYVLPFETTFNLQFLRSETLGWNDRLLTDRAYTFLITYLQSSFLEGRMEIYGLLLYNAGAWSMDGWRRGDIFGEDFQTTGRVSYDVVPPLEIGAGVIAFGGPKGSLLALARERNFAYLDLKYSF
ncbi:MAG: hypothetical protein M5R36_23345 [Deltaproteobacteria bacterium]|nr:hypothetical protein [Deltaproteobacteria bacterium]